jgi:hypothetical protein
MWWRRMNRQSGPVSRILFPTYVGWRPFIWARRCRRAQAPYPGLIASRADSSPPTWACWRWGLPCRDRHRPRGALLPHHFTLACDPVARAASIGGVFSVALSLGSLPVAVSHHRALSSSDFPPLTRRRGLHPPLHCGGLREAQGGVSRAAAWPTLPVLILAYPPQGRCHSEDPRSVACLGEAQACVPIRSLKTWGRSSPRGLANACVRERLPCLLEKQACHASRLARNDMVRFEGGPYIRE